MTGFFTFFSSQKHSKERAQAIVEFAIVLPILLAMLVGILETGRMVFMYAAVNNASREAARYASAFGDNGSGVPKYQDCDGIRDAARRSAFFAGTQPPTIDYDHGTIASTFDHCDGDGHKDTAVIVNSGNDIDRVTVTVTAHYKPMVRLIPFRERDFSSISSRTVLGVLRLK